MAILHVQSAAQIRHGVGVSGVDQHVVALLGLQDRHAVHAFDVELHIRLRLCVPGICLCIVLVTARVAVVMDGGVRCDDVYASCSVCTRRYSAHYSQLQRACMCISLLAVGS